MWTCAPHQKLTCIAKISAVYHVGHGQEDQDFICEAAFGPKSAGNEIILEKKTTHSSVARARLNLVLTQDRGMMDSKLGVLQVLRLALEMKFDNEEHITASISEGGTV